MATTLSPQDYDISITSQTLVTYQPQPQQRTWDPGLRILGTATLALLSLMAMVTNTLLIWVIIRSSQLRTSTNAFILSIACSDLVLGVFVVLPSAAFLQQAPDAENICSTFGVFVVLSQSATAQSLMMVSVDRCVAVTWSLKYTHMLTKVSVGLMLAAVWLLSLVFALLPVFGWGEYHFNRDKLSCTVNWNRSLSYALTQRICCTIIPGLVVILMVILILRAAFAHRRIFALMPIPGLAVAVGGVQEPSVNYRRSTLQAMKTLFFIVGALAILWTPCTVVDLLHYSQLSVPSSATTLATCTFWSYLSCILNPFVFLSNKKYKQRLKELVNPLRSKCSTHTRIQVMEQQGDLSRHTTMTPLPSTSDLQRGSISISQTSLTSAASVSRQLFVDTRARTLNIPTFITVSPAKLPKREESPLPYITPHDIPEIIVSEHGEDGETIIKVTQSPQRRLSREMTPLKPDFIRSNVDIKIHVPQGKMCNLSTI